MLTSIVSLALVLGTLAALLWWVRRAAARSVVVGRHIQVVETIALGPGRHLHLVRIAGRGLLIASTAQRCDLLCEFDSAPAAETAAEPSWIETFRSRVGRI